MQRTCSTHADFVTCHQVAFTFLAIPWVNNLCSSNKSIQVLQDVTHSCYRNMIVYNCLSVGAPSQLLLKNTRTKKNVVPLCQCWEKSTLIILWFLWYFYWAKCFVHFLSLDHRRNWNEPFWFPYLQAEGFICTWCLFWLLNIWGVSVKSINCFLWKTLHLSWQ